MTRAEHINALLEEYARQRAEDALDQSRRLEETIRKVPRIAELRQESASLAMNAVRSILKPADAGARAQLARDTKARGQAINAEIRELIKAAGLPKDILEMRYRCPVCRDTAYVGEAPAEFCECFKARLRLRQYEDGSMAGVNEQNFDTFNPEIIPEADGQRKRLLEAKELCERYADEFPSFRYRNILMTGEGGLGKTFLLNCIFERVLSRGFSAVRITAFRMFEAMRQQHLSNDDKYDGFSALIEAPLLLIDDLGTEPVMRNITVEYLFTLLNERAAAKRHTVVATNLTPAQLRERYGERVLSRLIDTSAGVTVLFRGRDLRKL